MHGSAVSSLRLNSAAIICRKIRLEFVNNSSGFQFFHPQLKKEVKNKLFMLHMGRVTS